LFMAKPKSMSERPFGKILVANRGEIAVRIIQTAKRLGVETVAVYSDADAEALHVLLADEAYRVGPPEPEKSYLDMDAIVEAAIRSGAEAIHPGYGFLSQNPEFVEKVEEAGLVFVGPGAAVQRMAGDKLGAKKRMAEAGVPVVPGPLKPLSEKEEVLEAAEEIGYPVMVKPVLGGGGIGMRICGNREELAETVELSIRLARSAFGRAEIYLERYFPEARHVEVQILADDKGGLIHLFERECSVQRRFQKLVEETPSPALNEEDRERLYRLALRAAAAIGYVNAGTVEFIYVPGTGSFYFLEVNSRIQVEHPVTEMITGVDIVEEQLWIAAGEPLRLSQNEVEKRGHAMEIRVNAEDPYNNFAPSPGVVERYLPPGGFAVRVDSGIYEGFEIPPFYDPLVAKLIVWGRNRAEAIKRMRAAIDMFGISGVSTNLPLHRVILEDDAFIKGDYNTRFLEIRGILERLPGAAREGLKLPPRKAAAARRVEAKPGVNAWSLSARLLACSDREDVDHRGGVRQRPIS